MELSAAINAAYGTFNMGIDRSENGVLVGDPGGGDRSVGLSPAPAPSQPARSAIP
jgi:hypothetical protein